MRVSMILLTSILTGCLLSACTTFKEETCGWDCGDRSMDEMFQLDLEECEWKCE